MRRISFLALFALAVRLFAAEAPTRMAGMARMDIMAVAGKLDSGEVTNGHAEVARANWIPPEKSAGSYTLQFRIKHIAWTPITFTFTPELDGNVLISLMGPWSDAGNGNLYKEEVLWSNVSINGEARDFQGWTGGAPINGEPETAFTWHNARKELKLAVLAGKPVTISAEARASVPPGFQDMARLQGKTPAHQAISHFKRGVNFGNYLEAPRDQNWGGSYAESDFKAAAAEGFDHVRVPMRWNDWAGPAPEFRIQKEFYVKCDFMVTNCLKNKLNVIVNIHHFDEFYKDPQGEKAKFFALWKQIAEHYKDTSPEHVAFELLNEPMDKATTEVVNPIFEEAIRVVRAACPKHTIFLGPGRWNSVDELKNLRLPANDSNLVVTVHCYDPFNFTHQGASWAGPHMATVGVKFPGPPTTPLEPAAAAKDNKGIVDWIKRYNTLLTEKNPSSPIAFEEKIQSAREWSSYYGRPVHFGEFGAIVNADDTSRATWYREFRTRLEQNDLAWAIWDWHAGFAYWNAKQNKPKPGMHEALFGR